MLFGIRGDLQQAWWLASPPTKANAEQGRRCHQQQGTGKVLSQDRKADRPKGFMTTKSAAKRRGLWVTIQLRWHGGCFVFVWLRYVYDPTAGRHDANQR
jgi:hypothetical protein